jgi:hypothetical protein
MTAIVIAHKTADFNLSTEGLSQAKIVEAIKAAGFTLGQKSLAALMNGSKTEAGDFVVKSEAAPTPKGAAAKAKAAKAKTEAPADEVKTDDVKMEGKMTKEQEAAASAWGNKPAAGAKGKGKTLTPEQAKLAADVEKALPTQDKRAVVRGTDWTVVLPQTPVEVKTDSKIHKLLVRLCDPNGATKKELMDEFGWSAGGLAGVIHWEPKAKGYFLNKMKRDDGAMAYYVSEIGTGRRYTPEEILTTDKRLVRPQEMRDKFAQIKAEKDAVKAVKQAAGENEPTPDAAPKAEAKAKPEATPKAPVKVPKDAPVGAGAGTVTRRSNKRQQATA